MKTRFRGRLVIKDFPQLITYLVIIQTFLIPIEIIPVFNKIFRILKLPILLALLIGYCIIYKIKFPLKKWMLALCAWIAILFTLTYAGSVFSKLHLIVDASFLLYGLLLTICRDDDKIYARYYGFSMLCTAITWIYSVMQTIKYPMLARAMASGSAEVVRSATGGASVFGVGGYDFIYGFVLLIPLLIHSMKNGNKYIRNISIFAFISGLLYVLVAQYTIAILLSVITIVMCTVNIKHKGRAIIGAVLLAAIVVESGAAAAILSGMEKLFVTSPMVAERLHQVVMALESGSLTKIDRMQLYQWNVNSFLQRPYGNVWSDLKGRMPYVFIGSSDSEWLYLFSYFGIPLALVLMLFFYIFKRESLKGILNSGNGMPVSYCWTLFFIVGTLNTVLRSTVCPGIMLFVLPCFARYSSNFYNNRSTLS